MSEPVQQPVLVYDRIDENRRNTRLILVIFGVLIFPPLVYVSMYLSVWVFMFHPAFFKMPLAQISITTMIALATVALTLFVHYRYATAFALKRAGASPLAEGEEEEFRRIVENLCIGAGLPQPQLYLADTAAPNAFTVGIDPEHASLAVTRGLLELLERRELEGVIAHELSHIGNHDIRLSTIIAAFVALLQLPFTFYRFLFRISRMLGMAVLGLLALLVLAGLEALFFWSDDPFLLSLTSFSLFMLIYLFFLAPVIGVLIRGIISQERELLADADAFLLTRNPQALALALAKIAGTDQANIKNSVAMAHLYIVDPLPGNAPWWDRIMPSHPPIEERIGELARMGGGIPPRLLEEAAAAGLGHAAAHPVGLEGKPAAEFAPSEEQMRTPPAGSQESCQQSPTPAQEKIMEQGGRIRKSDAGSVDRKIRCQICGTDQYLAADFKCTKCSANVSYHIEVDSEK